MMRRYGLGIVFNGLWLLFLAGHGLTTWVEHEFYPPDLAPWWLAWLNTSLENLMSEAWAIGWLVVLSSVLLYLSSPMSKDSDERQDRQLRLLLRANERLLEGRDAEQLRRQIGHELRQDKHDPGG